MSDEKDTKDLTDEELDKVSGGVGRGEEPMGFRRSEPETAGREESDARIGGGRGHLGD